MAACSSMKSLCLFLLLQGAESSFWTWPRSPSKFLGRRLVEDVVMGASARQVNVLSQVAPLEEHMFAAAMEEDATSPQGLHMQQKRVERQSQVERVNKPEIVVTERGAGVNRKEEEEEEDEEPFNVQPMRVSKGHCRAETSLITSLEHMDDGEHKVGCISSCRFGEVRHSWRECLERCVENRLIQSTLLSMLPEEHHAPHAKEVSLPDRIRLSPEVKRKYRLDRGAEL
mmetsp:Transcript_41064/g.95131  ORF Transcript_41064/g.95131 Transcript_41064/m.95131 type:complete len:228 (+) Transcript_41064:60-743(+)|eukprot:CAMPEP_0171076486 /NCGR_PEP_ID=MMETSP0766_2-20121228/13440_1 /TAXON_ID=439317 /ORGANISM="Gambierdiscus australes, Strain CAWD 149" /LENGTH=227 /DNA_ID=CAMNT_0011533465 /DNA_START=59 /DNA_END=742 /DNA_ORIENTATION=-